MRKTLLVVERIVLESLEVRAIGLDELTEQTGLSGSLLRAVLHQLIERGMIKYRDFSYELNWENKENWLPIVRDRLGVKAEIKELFSSLVNKSFEDLQNTPSQHLKMKKIWLEPSEQVELERKIKDIDLFLEGIQERRKRKPVFEKTCGKKVIFYGSCAYQDLVDDMLKAS